MDYKDLIVSPYAKVLSILNETKRFIDQSNKPNQKLISDINWITKVIQNHSLYSFEFSDKDKVDSLSKDNSEFKQFVDFISNYNKELTEMKKKNEYVLSKTGKVTSSPEKNQLRSKSKEFSGHPHLKYPFKKAIPRYSAFPGKLGYDIKRFPIKSNIPSFIVRNSIPRLRVTSKDNSTEKNKSKEKYSIEAKQRSALKPTKHLQICTSNKKISLSCSADAKQIGYLHTATQIKKFPFYYCEGELLKNDYDIKKILTKEFNLFELKKIVGHDNVLPIMGKTILEGLGIDDSTINTSKLESFLVTVSNSYFKSTLYHNSLHGADVTHTVSQIFLNSNALDVLGTNPLDIMSIIIGSLGHDIGHPGLTNNYHINAQTDMAMTYNDISCLENFHTSKLFSVAKNPQNNIFEKLDKTQFKTLRKRIVSMILATDMANHGKIMNDIKTKIKLEDEDEKSRANEKINPDNPNDVILNRKIKERLSKEDTKFDNQQSFLDYFIHAADLAHNTKLFSISLQWVELLSKEFWLQGDKEKMQQLPVSFLCDRENTNVPKSQVGFIKGFIIPTFDVLINVFPSLTYMVDNAKINMNTWQKICDEGRIRGWTPKKEKEKENNEDKKETENKNQIKSPEHNMNIRAINPNKKSDKPYLGKPKLILVHKNQTQH
ncbi:MAG: 3',5'-cyclic nucleotide phosphodiesterase [archaeon]|nr:3',5'-cyclic nucleotide phosphodiesterase [archaeon]